MPDYQPFLLPLLPADLRSCIRAEPGNPLDEEVLMQRFLQEPPDWSLLGSRIREQYGLHFLAEPATEWQVQSGPGVLEEAGSYRCLKVDSPEGNWFVMEHPAALASFDRNFDESRLPALARPSLFGHLHSCADRRVPDGEPTATWRASTTAGSPAAFHAWLRKRIGPDRPTDWHLEPRQDGYASRLRLDGLLLAPEPVSRALGDWLVNSLKSSCGLEKTPPGRPLEGKFTFPAKEGIELTVRVSIIPALHGEAVAARFLHPGSGRENSLECLGYLPEQANRIRESYREAEGLWLVCGPTGSGKSTTLHALLGLSVMENEKVLTIEDPVERTLAGAQQLELGHPPGLTFDLALRAFMRQSPDCLLVGEIRDAETAEAAFQAARSGHRVLSSIHARSTSGIRRRFLDLGQSPESGEQVCRLILHQRLVRRLCPDCSSRHPVPELEGNLLSGCGVPVPEALPLSSGCSGCHAGFRGRLAVASPENWQSPRPTREGLLLAAIHHCLEGRIPVNSLWPFLPDPLQQQFQLCHL